MVTISPNQRPLALIIVLLFLIPGCGTDQNSIAEQLAKAKQHKKENRLRDSVVELKILLKNDPQNSEARHLLGRTYLLLGDNDGAIKELSRAQSLGISNPQLTLDLIGALIAIKDYDRALQLATKDNLSQSSEKVRLLEGEIYLAKNELTKALDIFKSTYNEPTDASTALLGVAKVSLANNNFDEATLFIKKALGKNPGNSDAWRKQGEVFLFQNVPADAEKSFNSALKSAETTKKNEIILLLARAQSLQNKMQLAQETLDSISGEFKESPQVKYQQALILLNTDKKDEAAQILEKNVAKHPTYLKSYLVLATILYEKGSVEQAASHTKKILKNNPNHAGAIKLLAQIFLKENKASKAVDLLQRIPDSSRGFDENTLLGSAYLKMGETQKATKFYEIAALQAPDNTSAKTNVAISKIASGKVNSAISDLTAITKLAPDEIQAEILLMQILIKDEKYKESISLGNELLAKTPSNPLILTLLGTSYLGISETTEAEQQFKKALAADRQFIPALLNLAEINAKQGEFTQAKKLLEDALAENRDNIHLLMSLAKIELAQNNSRDAVKYLEQAITSQSDAIQPYLLLSEHYFTKKNYPKVQKLLKKMRSMDSRHPLVISLAGRMHSISGEHQKAERELERVVRLTPNSVDAYINLGTAQFMGKNYPAAQKSFEKVLTLSKGNEPIATMRLARIELLNNQISKAKKRAQTLQKRFPAFTEGYILSGDIFYIQKDYNSAIREYRKIDKKQITSTVALSLSNAYNKVNQPDKSIQVLTDWLKSNPNDVIPRLVLASNYESMGKNEHAIKQYENALKVIPDSPIALNNLAMLYQKQGDSRALEIANRAISVLPNNPAILDTAGWINFKSGSNDKAVRLLQKAAKLAPKDKEIAKHLAAAMSAQK